MSQPILEDYLAVMVKEGASDLILKSGSCPAIRMAGIIRFIGDQKLDTATMRRHIEGVLTERHRAEFIEHGAVDLAITASGGRFRCNVFNQSGDLGAVLRRVNEDIPSFKELNLPVQPLKRLASLRRGLILATGVAGSGKSTTLASMIDYINTSRAGHIVTVEDPIEFLHRNKNSLCNQREIGSDTPGPVAIIRHPDQQCAALPSPSPRHRVR